MSTGKRLAKRSILGTRIVAPGQDGRFYPAVIQNVSIDRLSDSRARYTVRFDNSRKVSEFMEKDLIGPGFSCVNSLSQLMPGQRVYLTHVGREMEGTIMSHDANLDQVLVGISVSKNISVTKNIWIQNISLSDYWNYQIRCDKSQLGLSWKYKCKCLLAGYGPLVIFLIGDMVTQRDNSRYVTTTVTKPGWCWPTVSIKELGFKNSMVQLIDACYLSSYNVNTKWGEKVIKLMINNFLLLYLNPWCWHSLQTSCINISIKFITPVSGTLPQQLWSFSLW